MTQALKDIVINALEEVKATNINAIDVRELTGMMDCMVVATGNSNRQVKSLATSVVVDAKKAGYELIGVEGDDTAEWILVDFGDVIVHIMLPVTREFYDLERLWSLRPGDLPEDGSGNEDVILGAPENNQ
jgi:ribosome-associated protein